MKLNKAPEREVGTPTEMHTISNMGLVLADPTDSSFILRDIAWALHFICRFNGHVNTHYSVLQHSLSACTLADPEHKMEALLHDAAEAYMGDIILPVKELFPDIAKYENRLAGMIFNKYAPDSSRIDPITLEYVKSPYMVQLDRKLANGESYALRRATGTTCDREVERVMHQWKHASPMDFMNMYNEIGGKYDWKNE